MVSPATVEGWYVRELGGGQGGQIWRITDREATCMGVTNPEQGVGTHYAAGPGETIWQALRRLTPWLKGMADPGPFRRMHIAPGVFHPRIARPIALQEPTTVSLPPSVGEERYISGVQNQLGSLIDALRAICRVVQPAPGTLAVYGHEIRNLLILAATEVEMHWRGILVANGRDRKFTTNDYVKLADPLRLADYAVRFHPCPDIDPVHPFALWDRSRPTDTLPWFAAYHGVKHNREFEFEKASLANAFSAVAACAVLLVAQFGEQVLTSDLSRFCGVEVPDWPLEEMYMMPQVPGGWSTIPHPALV